MSSRKNVVSKDGTEKTVRHHHDCAEELGIAIPKSLEKNHDPIAILRAVISEYKKRGLSNKISLDLNTSDNGTLYAYLFFHKKDGSVLLSDFYNRHLFLSTWTELIETMDAEVENKRKRSKCNRQ